MVHVWDVISCEDTIDKAANNLKMHVLRPCLHFETTKSLIVLQSMIRSEQRGEAQHMLSESLSVCLSVHMSVRPPVTLKSHI